MLLRVTLSVSVLLVPYYLSPTKSSGEGSDVPWLILELCVFGAVVGIQLPAISSRSTPSSGPPRPWQSSFRFTF